MVQYTVNRTGQDDLEFEGELLNQATSELYVSDVGTRQYDLKLYQQTNWEFVVTIDYITTCPNEEGVSLAELVDDPKDIENVLFAFEPCEFVDRKAMRAMSQELRSKFQKELFRYYDGAVAQMLETLMRMEPFIEQSNAEAAPVDSEEKGRRRFLGFLDRK